MSVDTPAKPWSPRVYRPTPQAVQVKALFYGRPGTGKTTLAASVSTVPEMAPALYINAESGLMSICEDWPDRIDTGKIDVVNFEGYKHLTALFEYLAFQQHPYKTVILDSLTELQTYVVTRWKDHLVPKGAEGFALNESDDKRMTMKIYERATEQLRGICRKFRDLPMHVLMVAHDDRSEENGMVVTHPALTPKFRDSVIGYMDIVGYVTTREVAKDDENTIIHLLTCVPNPRRVAKDRSPRGKLPAVMDDPTMRKVWQCLAAD